MPRNVYTLGKIDYNGNGRRDCLVTLDWEFDGERFSMSGNIWNPRRSDIYEGGQMVDRAVAHFPNDAKAQRMLAVWRAWHLNDMKAGSPAQEAYLAANPIEGGDYYKRACAALEAAGLNPDPSYLHNGEPYRYGTAWLKAEIPDDVKAEIRSWSSSPAAS